MEVMSRRLVQTLGRFFGHGSFFSATVEGVCVAVSGYPLSRVSNTIGKDAGGVVLKWRFLSRHKCLFVISSSLRS